MNGAQYFIAPAASPAQLLPANPRRKSVWIIATAAHTSRFGFGQAPPSLYGWVNTSTTVQWVITYDQIGALIQQPLWWVGTVADTITIVEGFE